MTCRAPGTLVSILAILMAAATALADDWPQLQHDPARTGRTADSLAAPYRMRWVWCGTTKTLRNRNSVAGWLDDLTSRDGYSFPIPSSVNVTLSEFAQPIIAGGKVFVGTLEGKAYAISTYDGATAWTANLQGAVFASPAVSTATNIAVYVTLDGYVHGLRTADGTQAWQFDSGRSISGAPCVYGSTVYVADQGGWVTALNTADGAQVWRTQLPKPVQGTPAADATSVYVGAENMIFYALNSSNGQIRAQRQLRGQSFSTLWPVVYNNKVWVTSGLTPGNGTEYVMESVMRDSPDFATEETNIGRWLTGDTNGGAWTDASPDWRHFFALNTTDLSEPYTVLSGPVEGCGTPPEPPCLDGQGRLIRWWKTRYPTLMGVGAFGTNYSIDLSAVDQTNGHRLRISFGSPNGMWSRETDNLYGLTTAGNYVWLFQRFRGLHAINLSTNTYRYVFNDSRRPEGGSASGTDIAYFDNTVSVSTPSTNMTGRCGPAISGSYLFVTSRFAIGCIETGN